jgi:hypothetical protein
MGKSKKSKGRISLLLSIPQDWMISNRKTSLRRWKKANPHG